MSPSPPLLFLSLSLLLTTTTTTSSDTTLIFKGCATQAFPNFNQLYKQPLQSLLQTLVSQSLSSPFSKSNSSSITALFQCRGDLPLPSCHRCVSQTPALALRLCRDSLAARVHLSACYLRYEIAGFRHSPQPDLLFKLCASTRPSGSGFSDLLDAALGEIAKGVVNNGFYVGVYQSVYVLGQCEGDLGGPECGTCVRGAVERVKGECGGAISGQVYMQECYVSYSYYPGDVPSGGNQQDSVSPEGSGRHTQKTVALVFGGLVGVGLVMACMLYAKSAFKKKPHVYKYGG